MNLLKFLEKLESDKALAAKYEGLSFDGWLEQAQKDGCTVKSDELRAYMSGSQSGAIDENALAGVNGGLVTLSFRQMPYLPSIDTPTYTTLPATGQPVTVQPMPFNGNASFVNDKEDGLYQV